MIPKYEWLSRECNFRLAIICTIILCFHANTSFAGRFLPDNSENINYAYAISSKSWDDAVRSKPNISEYKKVAKECKDVGNVVCEAAALYNIGTILYGTEYYVEAIPYYKKSLKKFESLNDAANTKLVLYNLIAAQINGYRLSREMALNYLNEGIGSSKRLLKLSMETDDLENELAAYNFAGILFVYSRDYYLALENYERILDHYISGGIIEGKGNVLNNIAAIYYYMGNFKKALEYLQNAVVVYMINGNSEKVKDIKNNIAIIYAETGDYEPAQIRLENLIKIAESGNVSDCTLFNSIGVIYAELCEFEKALKYYKKSLAYAKSNNMEIEVAKNLKDIGKAYEGIGELDSAKDFYRESLGMSNNFNDYSNIMALNLSLGDTYEKDRLYSVALVHYEIALKMAQELEDRKMEAYSLFKIGNVHSHKEDYKKSLDYLYKSFNLYRGLGIKKGQGLALVNISSINNKLKNFTRSKKYAESAINIFEEIHYYKHLKGAYLSLAKAYEGGEDKVSAEKYYKKAGEYDIGCGYSDFN